MKITRQILSEKQMFHEYELDKIQTGGSGFAAPVPAAAAFDHVAYLKQRIAAKATTSQTQAAFASVTQPQAANVARIKKLQRMDAQRKMASVSQPQAGFASVSQPTPSQTTPGVAYGSKPKVGFAGRPGQKIVLGQSSFFADEPKQTSLKSKKSSLKSKKVGKKIKPRIKINESFIKRNTKDCQRVRFKKKALPWAVYIRNIIEKTDEWECYGSCITSNELCMTDKDCDKNEKCSKQTGDKYLHYDYYGHYCCKDKPPTYEDGLRFISEILEPGLEYNPPKQKDLDQFTKVIAWYKAYFQKEIRLGKSVSDKYL